MLSYHDIVFGKCRFKYTYAFIIHDWLTISKMRINLRKTCYLASLSFLIIAFLYTLPSAHNNNTSYNAQFTGKLQVIQLSPCLEQPQADRGERIWQYCFFFIFQLWSYNHIACNMFTSWYFISCFAIWLHWNYWRGTSNKMYMSRWKQQTCVGAWPWHLI